MAEIPSRAGEPVGSERGTLIIECQPALLASQQLDFMGKLGHAAACLPDLKVRTLRASTNSVLNAGLHPLRAAEGRDLVVVIGHANPECIALTDDGLIETWTEFGNRLAPLRPKTLILLGCQAGDWRVADGLFRQIGSLELLVGSPLKLSAPQAAIGLAMHAFGVTRSRNDDWHLGQVLSTLFAGTLFWRWTRSEFQHASQGERALTGLSWVALAELVREKLDPDRDQFQLGAEPMDAFSKDVVAVLTFLLPGFLASWVFRSLTSFPKPSQFDQIVQALIITTAIRALSLMAQGACEWVGGLTGSTTPWTEGAETAFSLVLAVTIGIVLAWLINGDQLHSLLRSMGVTQESSFPTEWFSSFARSQTYVVLHLIGERRLYGWPTEWPSDPEKGHFRISEAEWLTRDELGKETQVPLAGVEYVVVPVKDVEMVEFMVLTQPQPEVPNGKGTAATAWED